jgi:hypothetical protein
LNAHSTGQLVHVEDNVLVEAQIVARLDALTIDARRDGLETVARLDVIEHRGRLGKGGVDAEALHISAQQAVPQEGGSAGSVRMLAPSSLSMNPIVPGITRLLSAARTGCRRPT